MESIYRIAVFLLGILPVLTLPNLTQLLYTDPLRDDGECRYPPPVPLLRANLLINPFKAYYIPVASENFFRFEYHMATNKPAETEDDVVSLQTRVYVSWKDLFANFAPIAVYFFGNREVNYSYRLSLRNPLFDFRATAIHGSNGTGPTGFAGEIVFTIIWNDSSPAYNIYTCIGGRQMFHIVSGQPTLTDQQFETNKKLLMDLGISPDNFQYLKY